jgi:fucose permease
MAFRDTYKQKEADAILGHWMAQFSKIFADTPNNPYAAMRNAADFLEGIFDLGHSLGSHEQAGNNLITLITDKNEKEKE